tara:strand:+ start:927 stop:1265 length:339 start_codon:yes stop_codon:yes gene_type:complete
MEIELKDAIKKEKLFCTEDGVDIFEGDIVYEVKSNGKIKKEPLEWTPSKYHLNYINNKTNMSFSTKKAAEEYILMNKPCLTLNEMLNYLGKIGNLTPARRSNLIEIVKSKLK